MAIRVDRHGGLEGMGFTTVSISGGPMPCGGGNRIAIWEIEITLIDLINRALSVVRGQTKNYDLASTIKEAIEKVKNR